MKAKHLFNLLTALFQLLFIHHVSALAGPGLYSLIPNGSSESFSQDMSGQTAWGFIENRGQYTSPKGEPLPQVRFVTDRPGMRLILSTSGFSYEWQKIDGELPDPKESFSMKKGEIKPRSRTTYRVDVVLLGANENPEIEGDAAYSDYINYYNVPQFPEGILNVRNYGKVIYRNIYPHIDWVLYSKADGGLKYDFIVHPGGDPKDIVLEYNGATELFLNQAGALQIRSSLGETTEKAPLSLQGGKTIESRYALQNNQLRFLLAEYDTRAQLIIDPCVDWATYYGGSSYEYGSSVKTDAENNVYLAGTTSSSNNISFSGHQNNIGYQFYDDAFLVKFSETGTRLWATYYGGFDRENGYALTIDISGNIYLTGETESITNIAFDGYQDSISSFSDAFLVKFSSSGVRIWGTYFGGNFVDRGLSIAIDYSNNVYLAGSTASEELIFNGHQTTFAGGYSDAFLVKFSSAGNLIWATYYGGDNEDWGQSVVCDSSGNVFLGGTTLSLSSISFNGHQNTLGGYSDAFLAKFSPLGELIWATYYGGSQNDSGFSIDCDLSGNLYLVGATSSANNISFNGHQHTFGGGDSDGYCVKFSPEGTRLWATYYGGLGSERIVDVISGRDGEVWFLSRSFLKFTESGEYEQIIQHEYPSAEWSSFTKDSIGNLYLAGFSESNQVISSSSSHQSTSGGQLDAYLAKYNLSSTPITPRFSSIPSSSCVGANTFQLPSISDNGIIGNWYPPNLMDFTNQYTFTPNIGQCASLYKTTITINPPEFMSLLIPSPATCPGLNDGSISALVIGEHPPYKLECFPGIPNGLNVSNLSQGSHSLTITDSLGCKANFIVNVPSVHYPEVSIWGTNFQGSGTYQVTWSNFPSSSLVSLHLYNELTGEYYYLPDSLPPAGTFSITLADSISPGNWELNATGVGIDNTGYYDYYCGAKFGFMINDVTGAGKLPQESRFYLSPNPANDEFIVTLEGETGEKPYTVLLFDIQGRLIERQSSSGDVALFNTENIPSGVYFVRIETKENSAIKKLVIQH